MRRHKTKKTAYSIVPPAHSGSDIRIAFDSIGSAVDDALTDYASSETNRQLLRKSGLDRLESGSSYWLNNFTMEKFQSRLNQADGAILDAITTMQDQITKELPAVATKPMRKIRRNLDAGTDLDPDRVIRREANAWSAIQRQAVPSRQVTIGINLCVSASNTPSDLLWRGAAAMALADTLTEQGSSVKIVLFLSAHNSSDTVPYAVTSIVAKDFNMPLDIVALAFSACEIAFARMVGIIGLLRHLPGTINSDLGMVCKLQPENIRGIDYLIDSDVTGKIQATAWLTSAMAQSVVT